MDDKDEKSDKKDGKGGGKGWTFDVSGLDEESSYKDFALVPYFGHKSRYDWMKLGTILSKANVRPVDPNNILKGFVHSG